jgi:hypothetical protein
MYLIFALVPLVFIVIGKRDLLHALLTAPLLFVSVFYLLSLLHVPFYYSLPLDITAGLVASAAVVLLARPAWRSLHASGLDAALLGLAAFAVVFFIRSYWNTFLLPAVDPVIVPACAKLIFDARTIPATLSPLGQVAFVYPPGFPALISTLGVLGRPLTTLEVYKHVNILVVACTPFVWALYLDRIYDLRERPSRLFTGALFVAGFFLFDGTLTLALPVAGKNAQLLSGLTLPVVLHSLLNVSDTWPRKIVAALSVLGATLVHYSFPYALAVFVIGYVLLVSRTSRSHLARLTLVPAAALLPLAPYLLSLKASHFALPPTSCSPGGPLSCIWRELTSSRPRFFFIYHDIDTRTVWPFKGLAVLGIPALALLVDQVRRRVVRRPPRFGDVRPMLGAVGALVSILAALVLGCEAIRGAGINYDYARWFAYTFSVLLFVLACRYMISGRWLEYTVACAVPLALVLAPSFDEAQRLIDAATVSHAQVSDLARALEPLGRAGRCELLTESAETDTRGTVLQRYKPLEYAYTLSGCVIVNGTSMVRPLAHSRDVGGLPGPEFYARLDSGTRLYFVGNAELFRTYLERIGSIAFEQTGRTGWNLAIFRYAPTTVKGQPTSWSECDIPASGFGLHASAVEVSRWGQRFWSRHRTWTEGNVAPAQNCKSQCPNETVAGAICLSTRPAT